MKITFALATVLLLPAICVQAARHDAGDGSGRMVFSMEDKIVEVIGACTDWNFQKAQDGNTPTVVSIFVNLDRENGMTISGLRSAMINQGNEFWAFEIDGDVDHTPPT